LQILNQHFFIKVSLLYRCASWRYIKLIVMTLQLNWNCALVSGLGDEKLSNASVIVLDSMDGRKRKSKVSWSFYWCHLGSTIESLSYGM